MFLLRKAERGFWTGIKIIVKGAIVLPLVIVMLLFNFNIDHDGLFQGERYERELALALLAGSDMVNYDTMEERTITALYVKNMKEPLDTVALGSSRILQLNRQIAGTDSFFNCGMSGGDFRDMLGTFYLFDKADMLPKNLILGLDPWLLSGAEDAWSERSDAQLYEEFINLKLGLNPSFQPPVDYNKYYSLFSPAYFQENLQYHFVDSEKDVLPSAVTGDVMRQDSNVKRSDGSVLYSYEFRDSTIEEVDSRAHAEASTFLRMDGYLAPDPTICDIFDRFVQYAESRGVNVIFMLTPYHPIIYTYAKEFKQNYPGFFLTEPWFTNYAKANNIPIYGSYNPFVIGTLEEDFYDGLHIRGEAISLYFPGVEKVAQQQKKGDAYNTWTYSSTRVTYDTAETLISRRYAINAPEVLLRATEEINIDGQKCYVLLRYESSAENATLLARYAVGQEDGAIYRYDTTVSQWVPWLMFT